MNLTIKERKAMQELQSRKDIVITDTDKGGDVVMQELQPRKDIVITDADKGGDVVILDVEDYVKDAEG